jgi:hypothetical protein
VLVRWLRGWPDAQPLGPDDLLFRTRNDRRPTQSNWSRTWHRALRSIGQQPLHVYDCRHAAATTWLDAGVPLGDVARRLGHSVETLVSTYVGSLAATKQRRTVGSRSASRRRHDRRGIGPGRRLRPVTTDKVLRARDGPHAGLVGLATTHRSSSMSSRVLFLDDSGKPDVNHPSNAVVIAGFSIPSVHVPTLSRRMLGAKAKFHPGRGHPVSWEIKAADFVKPNSCYYASSLATEAIQVADLFASISRRVVEGDIDLADLARGLDRVCSLPGTGRGVTFKGRPYRNRIQLF